MIAEMPTSRAMMAGRGKSFSAAMIIATTTITSGFIIPSTIIITIGATQQRQQATPCLQPRPKLASRSWHEVAQPNRERQPSRPLIFHRVNWNVPVAINAVADNAGTARLRLSHRVAAAANATPSR